MSSGVHIHRSTVDGEGVSPYYGLGANWMFSGSLGRWSSLAQKGMVWYGMVYLFFHRQYKVISKQIASEMLPYTVNERRPPYNPKVVLPQLLYR